MELITRFICALRFALARLIHWRCRHARFIVLMGGPGAGKGTLASRLAPALYLPHLSMGDVFRREIAAGSDLGKQAEALVKAGKLVPNAITCALLSRELQSPKYDNGAVLDGFPRQREQAELLEALLFARGNSVAHAVLLTVPEVDLIERLSNRRTCTNKLCGRTYHIIRQAPRDSGKCDACGHLLYQREDDRPEAIRERLAIFAEESKPLCDFYKAQGLLVNVQSTNAKSPEAVFAEVISAVNG